MMLLSDLLLKFRGTIILARFHANTNCHVLTSGTAELQSLKHEEFNVQPIANQGWSWKIQPSTFLLAFNNGIQAYGNVSELESTFLGLSPHAESSSSHNMLQWQHVTTFTMLMIPRMRGMQLDSCPTLSVTNAEGDSVLFHIKTTYATNELLPFGWRLCLILWAMELYTEQLHNRNYAKSPQVSYKFSYKLKKPKEIEHPWSAVVHTEISECRGEIKLAE